jgi:hypothetical protein
MTGGGRRSCVRLIQNDMAGRQIDGMFGEAACFPVRRTCHLLGVASVWRLTADHTVGARRSTCMTARVARRDTSRGSALYCAASSNTATTRSPSSTVLEALVIMGFLLDRNDSTGCLASGRSAQVSYVRAVCVPRSRGSPCLACLSSTRSRRHARSLTMQLLGQLPGATTFGCKQPSAGPVAWRVQSK